MGGDLSGQLMSPEERAAAIRENRDNPGVRALLQRLEDKAIPRQGSAKLTTTAQAGLSASDNGATTVKNVIAAAAATPPRIRCNARLGSVVMCAHSSFVASILWPTATRLGKQSSRIGR